MTPRPLAGHRVLVAGAGVFGLCTALALLDGGAEVRVADPEDAPNASAVAAGMLSPMLEAALDGAGPLPLLIASRDLWPALADRLDVALHRDGAVYLAAEADAAIARLRALDAEPSQPIAGWSQAVFTPEDWRLDAGETLVALRRAVLTIGGAFERRRVKEARPGWTTVLATGAGQGGLAPELAVLAPVRGQLLRFVGGPVSGPMLRVADGYLVPGVNGCVVGASMEPGRRDLTPETATEARQRALAKQLAPALAGVPAQAAVAIRATTPDGLPLVGWSRTPGVLLVVGARRNGWLLAPLVGRLVAAYLAGTEAEEPFAAAMDARRFDHLLPETT